MIRITRISSPSKDIAELVTLSRAEEFNFLVRLVDEFARGINTFDRNCEALFEARDDGRLVAVGGLNIDPYADSTRIGRVRRLYVHPEYRRHGVGRLLMQEIEAVAAPVFDELRLFTDSASAANFYKSLGYELVSEDVKATHRKRLDTGRLWPVASADIAQLM